MPRVPLLSGSRLVVVSAPVTTRSSSRRPRRRSEPIADVGAAVRDALRFPLDGQPLERSSPRGGRATIVVEPAALPLPASPGDPRQAALVAAVDELERLGVPTARQTILVAGGLARRPRPQDAREPRRAGVRPPLPRRASTCTTSRRRDLVELGAHDGVPLRVHRALVETDAVVVVTAAETVLHGGPAALLAARRRRRMRAAVAESLLETHLAPGWELALALERAIAARVPVIGASLTLDLPRLAGRCAAIPTTRRPSRGSPRSPPARGRSASSPGRCGPARFRRCRSS